MRAIATFFFQNGHQGRHEVDTSEPWYDLDPVEGPINPWKYAGSSGPPRIFVRRNRIHPKNYQGPFKSCVEPIELSGFTYTMETYYKELMRPCP